MTISFPHLGNYCVPIEVLLKILFPSAKVLVPPPNTKKTLELGSKHSPEFVCLPFKYNLGNFIEALEQGADILTFAGGGCRFGYYGELHQQILNDLGYNFEFVNFFGNDGLKIFEAYKNVKKAGSPVSFIRFIRALLLIVKMIRVMDKTDHYIRENIGFETVPDSFINLQKEFFAELKNVSTKKDLNKTAKKYSRLLRTVGLQKPDKLLRVGIVGELYTLMEPFSNFFLEKELAKYRVSLTRFTDATYLILTDKNKKDARNLKECEGYLKYQLGADGTHSVAKCVALAKAGYDGVIHVKPFGCMPEVNAMPALMQINKDHKIPVLFFSFDSQTSETGVKTRLEAFYDMLSMKN